MKILDAIDQLQALMDKVGNCELIVVEPQEMEGGTALWHRPIKQIATNLPILPPDRIVNPDHYRVDIYIQ